MNVRERAFASLPRSVKMVALAGVALQIVFMTWYRGTQHIEFKPLSEPLANDVYRVASLGSERLLSYLLILDLQLHDAQAGEYIPYSRLNFDRVKDWLLALYQLNPLSDYPGFLAARVYSQTPDHAKIRSMISVVETLFQLNPKQHWRRMTEACLLAKHHLQDMPLALDLARQLSRMPQSIKTPYWARDMELILLDEMNEKQSAMMLIASLLESGEITDNDERRFLQQRLLKIQQELSKQ